MDSNNQVAHVHLREEEPLAVDSSICVFATQTGYLQDRWLDVDGATQHTRASPHRNPIEV